MQQATTPNRTGFQIFLDSVFIIAGLFLVLSSLWRFGQDIFLGTALTESDMLMFATYDAIFGLIPGIALLWAGWDTNKWFTLAYGHKTLLASTSAVLALLLVAFRFLWLIDGITYLT